MRRRLLRWALAAGVSLVAVAGLAAMVSPDVRFLCRAGYEEARLLLRRHSLARLVANPSTPPALRARFEIVLAARAFAAESLAFKAGGTYTTYADVGRDTLVLVLSASPRTRLAEYVWWFPVVGSVPYHGYFSLDAGLKAVAVLKARGYDTYLRPAGAFSTLGWFSDPLVSSAMARDSVTLVSTVLHEISHNTLYVPSATAFDRVSRTSRGWGAERFFRSRGETVLADRAAAEWRDEVRLDDFYTGLSQALDSIYSAPVDDAVKLGSRETVFRRARERMTREIGPRFETYRPEWFTERDLNNATVIAARIYRTRLRVFDRVLAHRGGDIRAAVQAIAEAVRGNAGGSGDPFAAVERLTSAGSAGSR